MSIDPVKMNGVLKDNGSNHGISGNAAGKMSTPLNADPAKEADPGKDKNASPEQIQNAVKVANNILKMVDTGLEYEYNEGIDREVVRIYNRDTGETIKQIPPEDVVNMLTKMYDMLGVLYDKKF